MKLFNRYFKKHLTIKTKFNPNNSQDVQAFENAYIWGGWLIL